MVLIININEGFIYTTLPNGERMEENNKHFFAVHVEYTNTLISISFLPVETVT